MKDFVIKKSRILSEIRWAFACFLASFSLNILAIACYHTKWIELLTTLHITLLIALILYLLAGVIRTVFNLLRKIRPYFR